MEFKSEQMFPAPGSSSPPESVGIDQEPTKLSSCETIVGSEISLLPADILSDEDFILSTSTELNSSVYMSEFSRLIDDLEAGPGSQTMIALPVSGNVTTESGEKEVGVAARVVRRRKQKAAAPPGKVKLDAKVLRVRPVRRINQRQVVPEELKDAAYYAHRRKNTEAARKCRETKRALDQRRVEIITAQAETIQKLKQENAVLAQRLEFCKDILIKKH